MKRDKAYIRKWILMLAALIIMSFPMIQHSSSLIDEWELKGDVKKVPSVPFTMSDWFSSKYAQGTDEYMTNNFGLRTYAVRADNQIAYSLFGETRAKQVVIGKNNYLYEDNYIDAYTGLNFLGGNAIQKKVSQFKFIQDSLQARGKHLLVILAAGKASFYPEYIPDELMIKTDSTNYYFYAQELKKQGIQHIDFNRWFIDNKGKMRYPLYPKTGIHWSEYGMGLAADSLIKRIEKMGGWNLPDFNMDKINYIDERKQTDDDIELAMNMIAKFPNFKMAYPHFKINTAKKDSVSIIMISDSFFWRMYSIGVMPKVFPKSQFWYYNYNTYPDYFDNKTITRDLNLEEVINNTNVFVMMSSETNLHKFPWGVEERLSQYFKGAYVFDENAAFKRAVKKMEKNIHANKKWLEQIKEKADKIGISLDSMVYLDAVYMVKK
jgi:hypothetical protein